MSSIRNSASRLAVAAAGVALAALALSACGSDDGTGPRAEGSGTPTSQVLPPAAATSDPAATSKTGNSTATKAPAKRTGSGGTSGSSGSGGNDRKPAATKAPAAAEGSAVSCEGSTTRTVASSLTRPVNTMLLTVTNTGSHTCYLYGYPALRFTGAQAVPPAYQDSHPQAVVTLDPGESGYAAVTLSAGDGSGTHGHTVHNLTVYFQGRSGSGSIGAGATPPLPAAGVYIDDSLTTTYWQQSMDDAVRW
jgi:uncharacterized protein DUF4232